jgi:hypothetical protein
MTIPVSETEAQLFCTSTSIVVGNGQRMKFWTNRWLQGQALKDLALDLYRLAWRKNSTVQQAIRDKRWMRGLERIQTTQEIQQFVKVWQLVREVQFSSAQDEITWRLTQDGKYSTRSAYIAQFLGFFAGNN